MLLTLINQLNNSIKSNHKNPRADNLLWLVHSTDDSMTTRNAIIKTAYFYRIVIGGNSGDGEDYKEDVPPCNVGYSIGMAELHRLVWMAHSTLSGTDGVVIVKPGVVIGLDFRNTIREELFNIIKEHEDNKTEWGMVRGNHDKYFILNPLHSHCYKSNNIDELARNCEANNLSVIIDNNMIAYEPSLHDLYYKKWHKDDFGSGAGMILRGTKKVKSITNYSTKNIVYYSIYKTLLENSLDKYENSATFSTMEEFKDRLDEFPSDTTWVIGNFLVGRFNYFLEPWNELMLSIARVTTAPNSIIWGKLYHTADDIHSTLDIHDKGKSSESV